MGLLATAASLAMAFGAPLVYLDQALSISRQRDSTGFSPDIPALLIIANLTRCFFWLGERFEFALLLQSILMIISQIYLQRLILKYSEGSLSNYRFTSSSDDRNNPSRRRNVVFDSNEASTNGNRTSKNNQNATEGNRDRFNGRENLPTFDIVVQPPSPTSSSSNQNQANSQSSRKSSNDSKGRYSSLKTSHSDDPSNLSNSSTVNQSQDQDEEDDDEPTNFTSKIKKISQKIFKNFTTFSGQGVLQMENGRPFNFWRWKDFSSYIIFILIFIAIQTILYLLLGSFPTYISILGYLALGLESTLPIPQLISNQKRKSLSGFSIIVLLGWVGGDLFKTGYFIFRESPIQFIVCSCFQLSIDFIICAQLYFFREKTRMEDEERRKVQEVLASESGRNTEQEEWVEPTTTTASNKNNNRSKSSGKKGNASVSESDPFVLAEEEEEGEDEDDWARNAWSKAGSSKSGSGVGEVEADESEEEESGKGKAKGKARGRS